MNVQNAIVLKPMTRLVKFKHMGTVELAFPYTIFWRMDHVLFTAFSSFDPSSITDLWLPSSIADNAQYHRGVQCHFWRSPLPHVGIYGEICLIEEGLSHYEHRIAHQRLCESTLADLIAEYFGTVNISTGRYSETSLLSIENWAKRTDEEDLSFITQVDWGSLIDPCYLPDKFKRERTLLK